MCCVKFPVFSRSHKEVLCTSLVGYVEHMLLDSHLYDGQVGMVWLKYSADVLALQCHFFAGSVKTEQPWMFAFSKSISCLCEPP